MRVLILGSGLAGVTAAYYLHKLGCDVVVVDRAVAPGRETSYANGSMITPSLADPWNAPGVLRVLLKSLGREDAAILLRAAAIPSLFGWGISFIRNSASKHFERNYLRNVGLVHYSQWTMRDLLQLHPLQFDHVYDGTMKIFRDRGGAGLRHQDRALVETSRRRAPRARSGRCARDRTGAASGHRRDRRRHRLSRR